MLSRPPARQKIPRVFAHNLIPQCMPKEVESPSPAVDLEVDLEAGQLPSAPPEPPQSTDVLPPEVSLVICLATLTKSSVANALLRGSVVIVLLMGSRILLDQWYTAVA